MDRVIMTSGEKLILKQLRQAANNLSVESEIGNAQDREVMREGRRLVLQVASALEHGAAYKTESQAKAFDQSILNRETM